MAEASAKAPARELYDVIVIGGGPAGLTAAIYLARACYRVLVIEKEHFGGQITITDRVVNYPGIASISGAALTENMRQQAEAFGAEFKLAEVTALDMSGDIKTVHTTQGILSCFGVLLAAGARPRSAGFAGEETFRGRGVAYCATCDGEFFRGKQVFVIGGGYAAAEESVFLTKYASHVTCLVRGDDFSCAKATADEARNHPDITVRTHTVVESVEGDGLLRRLTCRDTETGEVKTYDAGKDTFGVFVFAGYEPATELVRGIADLDPKGYVITDASMKTSCDGLYAAGDIRIKPLRQCITAAAEGERPCVRVFCGGEPAGIAFHGVPGGHEFTSFVLGLYNAAGPGQALDESLRQRLLDWDTPCHLRIFVSLSCTLCPELVTAAQRLATLNPRITTDVYDLNLYPSLREAYQVMSVPCFLINEDGPHFGKKTAAQLLDLMEASRA